LKLYDSKEDSKNSTNRNLDELNEVLTLKSCQQAKITKISINDFPLNGFKVQNFKPKNPIIGTILIEIG
jgi:hypothetical protein